MKTLDQPALYLTTQTTLPALGALAAGFNFAAIGFVLTVTGITHSVIPFVGLNTKEISIFLLTLSSFLFLFSVTACVKSHAWDYHALSNEQRSALEISTDIGYQSRCDNRSRLWHRFAAWSYNSATFIFLFGLSALMWDISRLGSILALSFLAMEVLVSLFTLFARDKVEQITAAIERYMAR